MLLVLNLPLIGLWVKLLTIPKPWLYAGILVFATLGTIGDRAGGGGADPGADGGKEPAAGVADQPGQPDGAVPFLDRGDPVGAGADGCASAALPRYRGSKVMGQLGSGDTD
jgi:hypothetical protein